MAGPHRNDGMQVQEYVYDFAVDGGAAGAIVLSSKAGKDNIPIGAVIKGVTALVQTALAGGTSLAWGNGDDPDGYSGVAIVTASLVINANFNGWDNAAALLWDDTNDHAIYQTVVDAADGRFDVLIAGTMTAGKVVFFVEYFFPKAV